MNDVKILKGSNLRVDYVLLSERDENGKELKKLKPLLTYQAEEQLGRKLSPGEIPVRITEDSPVIIKSSGLVYPHLEHEVKDLAKYPDKYAISSDGNLISKRTDRIVNLTLLGDYPGHVTKLNGRKDKCTALKIHRCVAETFIPNPEMKPEVNHKNGDKNDFYHTNLEFVTSSENRKHAVENNLHVSFKGSDHPSSKFNEQQVLEIRERAKIETNRSIAKDLEVHHSTISRVVNHNGYF